MFFFSKFFKKKPRKVVLGLSLGSGGAKGFAELGVLKAFEENGIEFDVVSGTSIGSIIGAFYANGYTSTDIGELLKRVDIGEIKNVFMLKMDMSGLFNVLDRSIGSLNIEELKKPFMTVATVMDTGEEQTFDKGRVADALCASSCFVPFFKPYEIDGVKYVDGAYANSIPADKVRLMGAEYVVSVDLSVRDAKPTLLSKLLPTYEGKIEEPWKVGYDNSDVVIHPDLREFTSTSFSSGDIMFERGYASAIEVIPKIKKDIENLKFTKSKKR